MQQSWLVPVIKNLTYTERLEKLNLPSLKFRRIRGDLIQTFKIFSGLDDISITDIFEQPSYSHTRNSMHKIFKKHSKTNKGIYAFSNRVINFWNNLSNKTKQAKNINTFKNLLQKEITINKLKYISD